MAIPQRLLNRYLDLLGLQRKKPSVPFLNELIQAQLQKIPFENLSKLYYNKSFDLHGIPELEVFLDGIERFHFGGTCYSLNYHFNQLLAGLGYQIILCGADMRNPDVHLVSVVTIEDREYLVDVGYAAPFVEVLPRDISDDCVIFHGRDRYILRPQDASGRSQMALFRDGKPKHGYCVNPKPRHIREFKQSIADSYRSDSTFMNTLLLARFFPGRSFIIHNFNVIKSKGRESEISTLNSKGELVRAIYDYFSVPMEFSKELVMEMELSGDAWN